MSPLYRLLGRSPLDKHLLIATRGSYVVYPNRHHKSFLAVANTQHSLSPSCCNGLAAPGTLQGGRGRMKLERIRL